MLQSLCLLIKCFNFNKVKIETILRRLRILREDKQYNIFKLVIFSSSQRDVSIAVYVKCMQIWLSGKYQKLYVSACEI